MYVSNDAPKFAGALRISEIFMFFSEIMFNAIFVRPMVEPSGTNSKEKCRRLCKLLVIFLCL